MTQGIRTQGIHRESFCSRRRRDSGSAMLIAVMMLILMGLLGLAAVDMAGKDQQIAGLANRSRAAFYAAEAGASHGRQLIADADGRGAAPVLPNTALGDPAMYARYQAQPRYFPDPNPPARSLDPLELPDVLHRLCRNAIFERNREPRMT